MPKFYLQRPDGTYSDAGFYNQKPADNPAGTWVEGEPQGERYKKVDVSEVIKTAFESLAPQMQLALAPYAGLIYAYLADKKPDKAKTLVSLIPNPFNQGSQPDEYQLLEAFRNSITGA